MKKILTTLILICTFFLSLVAQPLSTTNKKARELYLEAQQDYSNRNDSKASILLIKAIKKDSLFIEAHLLLANIYNDHGEFKNALIEFQKVVNINPTIYPTAMFNLAGLQMGFGYYSEAAFNLEQFLKSRSAMPNQKIEGQKLLASAKFAENAMKSPVPFDPKNLGAKINTINNEYLPSITADEQTIVYTVMLPRSSSADLSNPNNFQEDFYYGNLIDGKWDLGMSMGSSVNTEGNEGAQSISADGKILFFTACQELDGYPGGREGFGRCDIFFSRNINGKWSVPKNAGPPISTPYWDSQPCLSPDGSTLYFSSNRPGGKGGLDLWKCSLDDKGWGKPVNLGDSINTNYNETSPFIHPDNHTFYFSSGGHPGFGKDDLYFSHLNEKGEFSKPVNLGYPINTLGNEISLVVSSNGKTAYYASERKEGYGGLDLYSFELPEKARATTVTYLKGKVFDKKTKGYVQAKFELIDLATSQTIMSSFSDGKSGEFLVCLPVNKNYALNVSKNGYMFYSENFSLKEKNDSKPYLMDIPLQPIDTGTIVELKNIFFETNKFDLKEESKVELQKLMNFLNVNINIRIEISGHTDNVGDKKLNQVLSQNRAKSVYDYLINNGIDKTRLSFRGYGDTKPVVANDTPENKARNRRTEFKVVSLK
jgi:outer membrane protein OmpA-like peptidoglycan-associated protein